VIERALRAGHVPRSVLMTERWLADIEPLVADHDGEIFVGDAALLETLTGYHLHRGALAAMHRPVLPSVESVIEGARRVVVLEDIVDHTNVGAIFRAVAGLGADAVRVSMGTVLQVPWTRLPDWPEGADLLRASGFEVAALALSDDAVALDEYAAAPPERVALVLGTEGDGLSPAALRAADRVVTIPMLHGVDSLNVAAASAVALWALRVPAPASAAGADAA